ncbi:MAG: DUF6491 family protein [Pseudomonadota bacterium]
MRITTIAALLSAVSLSVAFAEDDDDAVDPRLGEKVDRICFASNVDNWRSTGENNEVLLEEGINDWYFVELSGLCRKFDIRSAEFLVIDTFGSSSCVTRGDSLIFKDFGGHRGNRCVITSIYEWDEDAEEVADEDETETEEETEA